MGTDQTAVSPHFTWFWSLLEGQYGLLNQLLDNKAERRPPLTLIDAAPALGREDCAKLSANSCRV